MLIMLIIFITTFIISVIAYGFGFTTFAILTTTVMACGRKFGYKCSLKAVLAIELVFIFMSIVLKLIFHSFHIVPLLVYLIMRAIFVFTIVYDDTQYVYITEEEKVVNE